MGKAGTGRRLPPPNNAQIVNVIVYMDEIFAAFNFSGTPCSLLGRRSGGKKCSDVREKRDAETTGSVSYKCSQAFGCCRAGPR